MPRKRHAYLALETALDRVVRLLERDDAFLREPEPEASHEHLIRYRHALLELLTSGPLDCSKTIAREENTDRSQFSLAQALELRAEVLQVLYSFVRNGASTAFST